MSVTHNHSVGESGDVGRGESCGRLAWQGQRGCEIIIWNEKNWFSAPYRFKLFSQI